MAEENTVLILLGEVKGKLDSFILSHSTLNKRVDEHDHRLIKIEHKLAWILGASGGISLLVGYFLRFFH